MKNTKLYLMFVYISISLFDICTAQTHIFIEDSITNNEKTTWRSWEGRNLNPSTSYRFLNIMINIIYDIPGIIDPYPDSNPYWNPATIEGINNQSIPTYLEDFIDVEIANGNPNGALTRLYYESSFGALVILGDFIVVNIKLSNLTQSNPGLSFNIQDKRTDVLNFINENGGLNTLLGHNAISDFDSDGDGNIDLIQFLWRNTTFNYGGVSWGSGYSGVGFEYHIKVNGIRFEQRSSYSNQGVGNGSNPLNPNGIVVHEISHQFLGGNTFHTSGGNHYSGGQTNTWFGLEGGFGLMGAYNSGLVSCNGYERWRLHWTSPVYNPNNHLIQANGIPSDISKADGSKTFVLRDFVTTGDVIRIKLPYKDDGASNQYIWLENHQIGSNNKLDYLHYSLYSGFSVWHSCRPIGSAGIYSYIQVGKDILEGAINEVYPTNETDNLRIISAEGNWDFIKLTKEHSACVATDFSPTEKRILQNPLSGYQDQTAHFFDSIISQTKLSGVNGQLIRVKYDYNHQLISNSLAAKGDELDAFQGIRTMDIGTNPTPVNQATYYVNQQEGNFQDSHSNTNTSHIYLSGLKINMFENQNGTFLVDIVWDDYEVKNDVRWTGNIVLKEKVILKQGKTITLDQSLTPNQINRDPVSNLFAKPTVFRCDEDSQFQMEDYSTVNLINKSTLLLKEGSRLIIGNDASLIVNTGDTLKIESCAKLIIRGNGQLVVNNGGVLCISPGAILATDKGMSNISLNSGFIIPSGFIHPNQVVPPTTSISGNVTWSNKNYHVNSLTINTGAHLTISNSTVRFGADFSKAVIKPGGRITVTSSTLTNSCNDPWQGIYIEGDRTKTQTFANQGALILQNGAVIENGTDAIRVRSVDDHWHGNGGIIQADDAIFRNNWRNVEFNAYDLQNISYFTNCSFETDENSLHDTHTSNVSMWDLQGVTFTGCTFKDTRQNINYHDAGQSRDGIYTINASFEVENCNFEEMKYGINAVASVTNRTFKVYDSDFASYKGIYFSGMDNVHIVDNDFFVKPGYMYPGPNAETYGLYLENAQNFEITGNDFTSTGISAPCYCNSYGVIARNTGTLTHEIYRNDFSGFQVGIQAIGQNRADHDFAGLQIRCNRFSDTHSSDITVVKDFNLAPAIKQGIKQQQGALYTSYSNTSLAGNIFSDNRWYYNSAEPFGYYHHDTQSHANLVPGYYSSDKITLHQKEHNYQYETSCPERQILRSTQILLAEMEEGLTGQRETERQLLEKTDAGNTMLMVQQVEMANELNGYDTYLDLMKTSPWLSDEVLAAVAAKEEGITHAMIRDILVANAQSAKSDKVTQALDSRRSLLSGFMRAQIASGINRLSEKELLELQVAAYKTLHDMALNQLIRNTMHTPDNKEELTYLEGVLAGIDDMRYQYLLTEMLFSRGDYTGGMQLLASIESRFSFEGNAEWNNHRKYVSFYTLLEKWDKEEYPGFTNLPAEALQGLESYLHTEHRTAGKALAILRLNNAIDYTEPIFYAGDTEKEFVIEPQYDTQLISEGEDDLEFSVYPNPGTDVITLDWCNPHETFKGGRIEIRNAFGVLIQTLTIHASCSQAVLPVGSWRYGNYFATIYWGNASIKHVSFVIAN